MSDIWAEGKYLDFWSVNHLLSGFIAAGWLMILGSPLWLAAAIASALFWGWEIFEYIFKIEEITNQLMDLVTDYVGFSVFFLLVAFLQPHLLITLIITSIIFILLEVAGYLAYRKRSPK